MATSDNPFVVPNPVTDDEPEDHQHEVPIVNIDDGDRETLEEDYNKPANGVDDEPEDEVPEEDPDDEPLADQE